MARYAVASLQQNLPVVTIVTVTLLLVLLGAPRAAAAGAGGGAGLDAEEQGFVALLNAYRARNGLGPVAPDPALDAAADWLSADMLAQGYFGHVDSLGRWPAARAAAFGYPLNAVLGEDIAWGYAGGAAVLAAWQQSPAHNAALLASGAGAVGVGRVCGAVCYWTADFGAEATGATAAPATATAAPPTATAAPPTPTATAAAAAAPTAAAGAGAALDGEETTLLALLNAYRAQNGLGPLAAEARLTAAADWMSADMLAHDYFSHVDSLGRFPSQRDVAFGYPATAFTGENLAAGYTTAAGVLGGWQASPSHNAQLLAPDWVAVGIGRACAVDPLGAPTYCYWTADFGNR